MVIFSFCTSTTATPPSLLLLSSPHKHTSDLLVSPSASSSSSSPLAASETSSHQEFSVSPPINTLLFFPCPPPPTTTTKEEHLVYNYSTPYCLHLLSSPLIPLFLPAQSPHLPPSNTPQINTSLIKRGRGCRAHRTQRRQEGKSRLSLLSLSLYFYLRFFLGSISAKPQQQLLPFFLFLPAFSLSLSHFLVAYF